MLKVCSIVSFPLPFPLFFSSLNFFIFEFFVFINHLNFFINLLLVLLVDHDFESLLEFFPNHPLPIFHLKYLTFFLLQLLTFAHCFIEIYFYFLLLLVGDEFTQAHLVCVCVFFLQMLLQEHELLLLC
jgi:hypothetical protein